MNMFLVKNVIGGKKLPKLFWRRMSLFTLKRVWPSGSFSFVDEIYSKAKLFNEALKCKDIMELLNDAKVLKNCVECWNVSSEIC